MVLISLIVTLVIAALIKYVLHMYNMEKYVRNLPVLSRVYPFFGNSLSLIAKSPPDLFKEFTGTVRELGTPIKAYIGPFLIVTIDKPEDFKTVLMSRHCLGKPYLYKFYPSDVGIASATCECFFACNTNPFRTRVLIGLNFTYEKFEFFNQ